MKLALTLFLSLALGEPAFAAGKGTGKPPGQSADEMDRDHRPAPEQATKQKGAAGLIVRGAKIEKAPNISLAQLLKSPERQEGKSVVVEGKVRRACTRMGCWMELAELEKGPGVRVTFKDYGFFVPTDSAGANAKVEGTVKLVELSDHSAAHYQSEGGRVAKDREGKYKEVQLVASGVELNR